MSRPSFANRLRAGLLVLPLVLFLAFFFIWPLWAMMTAAVVDDTVSAGLPETAVAIRHWDGAALPSADVQGALQRDLRDQDQQLIGDAIRRLNSEVSGFRTLMSKTQSAVRDQPAETTPLDLASVDKRWADPRYWQAIQRAAPPWTDRNLLASVDLQRGKDGGITAVPAEAAANRTILIRTFVIAGSVTLLCILIGLPYAMLAASVTGWKRNLLLLAVLLPLWTSLLVRTTAWFILLQNEGLINKALEWIGLIDSPLPLIFDRTGVVIAMTHVLLPFMVLPIYSVVVGIPRNLMPAAASMGANPWRAFYRVLLPLSVPGILSGALLVFMVAIGYYITPALLGGPNDQMISSVIAFYATGLANWGMAGALGIILLLATIVLYGVYNRFARSSQLLGT